MFQDLWLFMMILIIYGCSIEKLACQDLISQLSCEQQMKQLINCKWNQESKKCETQFQKCITYSTQGECGKFEYCEWSTIQNQCLFRKADDKQYCSQIKNEKQCISEKNDILACTWEHNKCVEIKNCQQINDYSQCRNARFENRCQIVVNGESSYWEKEFFYMLDAYNDFECRQVDCKFHTNTGCKNFINGRRCFTYYDECTQCSYFTSSISCIDTDQYTWSDNKCRNILCSDYNSKSLCLKKPFCYFNETVMKCENKIDDTLYCYNRDQSSDPLK